MHVWGKVSLCYIQVWIIARGEKCLRCHRGRSHTRVCTIWLLCGTAESREGRQLQPAPSLPCERAQERKGGTCGNLVTMLLQWEFFSAWGTPYSSRMPQEMCLASLLRDHITDLINQLRYFPKKIFPIWKKVMAGKTPESKAYFLVIFKVL